MSRLFCTLVSTYLLVIVYPEAWTMSEETGEPSLELLLAFVSQGSRFSGPKFWQHVELLIEKLPENILNINEAQPISKISDALKNGIMTENRMTVDAATDAYLSLMAYVLTVSELSEIQATALKFATDFSQRYLIADDDLGKKIGSDGTARSISSFVRNIIPENDALAITLWNKLVTWVTEILENPSMTDEANKKLQITRWIALAKRIGSIPEEYAKRIEFGASIRKIARLAISMIQSLDGTLIFTAFFLENLLKEFFALAKSDSDALRVLNEFAVDTIPALISSVSYKHLINIWVLIELGLNNSEHTFRSFRSILTTILASSLVELKDSILVYFLQEIKPIKASLNPFEDLERYVLLKADSIFESGSQQDWDVVIACLLNERAVISSDNAIEIIRKLTRESLYDSDYENVFFRNLIVVAQQNLPILAAFIKTEDGSRFSSRLWQVTETPDDASASANAIRKCLEGQLHISQSEDASDLFGSLANAILRDVETNPESTCESMVTRTLSLWESANLEVKAVLSPRILFLQNGSLKQFIDIAFARPLAPSVSLINIIGGAMYLCNDATEPTQDTTTARIEFTYATPSNDMKLFRIVAYILQLLEKIDVLSYLPYADQLNLFLTLQQAAELAKDSININGSGRIPSLFAVEDLVNGTDDLLQITEKAKTLLETKCGLFSLQSIHKESFSSLAADDKKLPEAAQDDIQFMTDFVSEIGKRTRESHVSGFYAARVLASLVAYLAEDSDFSSKDADALFENLGLRRSKDTLANTAFFEGLSKYIGTMTTTDRLRNEVASDILGLRPATLFIEGLKKVVVLNSLVHNIDDESVVLFPPQRAVMLMRRILDMAPQGSAENLALRAEATKLLNAILPAVKDLYGEHWTKIISSIAASLTICEMRIESDEVTPLLFHSLKLFARVNAFQSDNDDIADALSEDTTISDSLLRILSASLNLGDRSQARLLCDSTLSRQILDISIDKIADPVPLFPILAVESEPLQKTVLKLASRAIPAVQESLAVEAALDTHGVFNIELPVELLSLVMSVPEEIEGVFVLEEIMTAGMTSQMRSYLYTWKLIFEYLDHAVGSLFDFFFNISEYD